DRARERLTGDYDGLERGLERGAPALPAFGVECGGGGDRCLLDVVDGVGLGVVLRLVVARVVPVARRVEAHDLTLSPGGLVDGLRHVERLREAGAVEPGDRVADLEASFLNCDRKPVPRPRTAERQQVPAGLQHSQALTRPLL